MSKKKKGGVSRGCGWGDIEKIQYYSHLLWTSNPGGKNVSSPFPLVHQIFLPVPVLHASKKNEVFVSPFLFIYSSVAPKARSLMQWKLPLETLQQHVKSHNEVLPYHVKLLAVENQRPLLKKDSWYVEHGVSFLILFPFLLFQSYFITQLPITVPQSPVRGFHTTTLAGSCRRS